MTDDRLRRALRDWHAAPSDSARLAHALAVHDQAGVDPPWELLAASPEWAKVVGFARKWLRRPLGPEDGCSVADLEEAEARIGLRLPRGVREFHLLAGRQPDLPWRRPRGQYQPGFSNLTPLELLEVEERGVWVGTAHQAGEWVVDSDGVVHYVRDLGGAVGTAAEFYLAFLFDEFGFGGPCGSPPHVRFTLFPFDVVSAVVGDHYAPIPLAPLFGRDGRPVLGDADTFVVLEGVEFGFTLTRTQVAWERARALFGPPIEM